MTIWGAEIPVTIVDRKPDFVEEDDICCVYQGHWYGEHYGQPAKIWSWRRCVKIIKLLATHPYYKKEKPMAEIVISREAAIEALSAARAAITDRSIASVVSGSWVIFHELAKAKQQLWNACPEKRPVDNRVIAMRHAWMVDYNCGDAAVESFHRGDYDVLIRKALAVFDTKLAELEG